MGRPAAASPVGPPGPTHLETQRTRQSPQKHLHLRAGRTTGTGATPAFHLHPTTAATVAPEMVPRQCAHAVRAGASGAAGSGRYTPGGKDVCHGGAGQIGVTPAARGVVE